MSLGFRIACRCGEDERLHAIITPVCIDFTRKKAVPRPGVLRNRIEEMLAAGRPQALKRPDCGIVTVRPARMRKEGATSCGARLWTPTRCPTGSPPRPGRSDPDHKGAGDRSAHARDPARRIHSVRDPFPWRWTRER